jgi:hypothetical protein
MLQLEAIMLWSPIVASSNDHALVRRFCNSSLFDDVIVFERPLVCSRVSPTRSRDGFVPDAPGAAPTKNVYRPARSGVAAAIRLSLQGIGRCLHEDRARRSRLGPDGRRCCAHGCYSRPWVAQAGCSPQVEATLGRGHSSSLGRAAQHKAILPNRGVPKSLRTSRHGQRQVSEDKVPKDRRRPR